MSNLTIQNFVFHTLPNSFVDNMRDSDKLDAEVLGVTNIFNEVQWMVDRGVLTYALMDGDTPILLCGLLLDEERDGLGGKPWVLATHSFLENKAAQVLFMRASKPMLDEMFKYTRFLYVYSSNKNVVAQKWLSKLGFKTIPTDYPITLFYLWR